MRLLFRVHEWLADRVDWVQYPRPNARSLSSHATGWRLCWQTRPPMNRASALCLPTLMLFVPYIGVYLSILSVIFLFAYFRH